MKLNEISNREELAIILGIPVRRLTYILYHKKTENLYTSFTIPKKNGEERQIDCPNGELREIQKRLEIQLLEYCNEKAKQKDLNQKISHAFIKKKSIVTNAAVHRNKRYILSVDLKDFFQSIHFGRVMGYFQKNQDFEMNYEVAVTIAQIVCYRGCLPQGAPTSPLISNLIGNIVDMSVIQLAKKYRLSYTRYADDMTFSTNDKHFLEKKEEFICELREKIEKNGFKLNESKTRLTYKDSRQEVTGIVVNKIINTKREFIKNTRAMANKLYYTGKFKINGEEGTINQLDGRFAFINQQDKYNNTTHKVKKSIVDFNSREREYQKFLFYRYFVNRNKPLIITEGKTDVLYLKAALKKYYKEYPNLIKKNGEEYSYRISFLKRSKRVRYFWGMNKDGADAMMNIVNFYKGKNKLTNYAKMFKEKYKCKFEFPVILLYDNEQVKSKPLKKLKGTLNINTEIKEKLYVNVEENLFILTNPLVKGKSECEIEDLFTDDTLAHEISGKKFERGVVEDKGKTHYGKSRFSQYIYNDYENIDFSNFVPLLDALNEIVS